MLKYKQHNNSPSFFLKHSTNLLFSFFFSHVKWSTKRGDLSSSGNANRCWCWRLWPSKTPLKMATSCSVADCNLGNNLCCCCCLHPRKSAPSTRQFDWRVQALQHAIVNGDTMASCRVHRESAIPSCDLHVLYLKKSTMQGLL